MTFRRGLAAATLAAAVVLSGCLSGCSASGGSSSAQPTRRPVNPAVQTPPQGAAKLSRYYSQQLAWTPCGPADCAKLTVPLDYAAPEGASIQLAVLRVRAESTNPLGSLVVNPGGPGGSGVDYALAADLIVGQPVRQRYDVVGFDPRGVGRSEPITCLDDKQLDGFLGTDPTPDDKAEERSFAAVAKSFADACKVHGGPLLAHVSTEDAARDMDVLRSALGDAKLNYLGKSYGTFLGATYAGLFPKRVGRFVLDGVVAPDLTSEELDVGQAAGFELATSQWAKSCVAGGDCPLGASQAAVMQGLRDLLKRLDQQPAPLSGDPRVTALTEGWASLGIGEAMYEQSRWATLTDALRDLVRHRNAASLMDLADQYANRGPDGHYTDNLMQVIYAVNCLDRPASANLAAYEQESKVATAAAPTWGPFLAWSSLPCGFWPVKTANKPAKITAAGSGPIVVVGTTRDPATPYAWAVRLRGQLANASLVTFDGDGHTAYMRSNGCVDSAVNDYYVAGTVPRDGLRC